MDSVLLIYISMALFAIGVLGVLIKRNALVYFLSVELMLNAANLLFVSFSWQWGQEIGLLWVFFVLLVSAAEATVGLALIIHLFRTRQSVDLDQYDLLKE